jgi:hypothetical protein
LQDADDAITDNLCAWFYNIIKKLYSTNSYGHKLDNFRMIITDFLIALKASFEIYSMDGRNS